MEGKGPGGQVENASPHEVLSALQELADQLGIEVRIEPFELTMSGKGGLCRINGRRVILVADALTALEQVGVVAETLGKVLPKGFSVPVSLQPYLRTGHGRVHRLLRLRPLARVR